VFQCESNLTITADPIRLEQIFLNLLDNARKYSEEDTAVKLTVTHDADHVSFTLEDEGIGIDQAELPHIFNRLYRVEKSRSRELGGSGLGLSIVKELVEAHNGDISAASTPRKGTTVRITMPKKDDTP
jgi:signal transduction histidine kinase